MQKTSFRPFTTSLVRRHLRSLRRQSGKSLSSYPPALRKRADVCYYDFEYFAIIFCNSKSADLRKQRTVDFRSFISSVKASIKYPSYIYMRLLNTPKENYLRPYRFYNKKQYPDDRKRKFFSFSQMRQYAKPFALLHPKDVCHIFSILCTSGIFYHNR
ncbi:hypothetical protein HMPREF1221_02046 [Treponema socranskii subsp. paredis ATCC 35535]|nr:hypothetical protein HMPREF1221_02046 [Treponema socranskii subsp. paredis ATCC 35535]